MKYIVDRASYNNEYGLGRRPCEEAFLHPHENWEVRTCDEDTFNSCYSHTEDEWHTRGKNHTITPEGFIARQHNDSNEWTVEINSMEELNAFIKKYGQVIISPPHYISTRSCTMTIYDDCIE